MKAGNGHHFEQSDNAQAAVDVESRLIVGERVSQAPNDKQELVPALAAIPAEAGPVAAVLVVSSFFSEAAVRQVEPVFGILKSVLGFRQFLFREVAKVSIEWTLVCLACNLKRLHRLGSGSPLAATN